ncbi:cAMP-binding domain of CRP or a regulatory subunit of cAMP-dependent protein kinases [Pseudarcicella hirudinis]|uniref:cAMP-binding domain of CRP or a regulatory subunit of cAMP-dependent protein kinases n=1 Tax=Pseudarcicella hirudinis TaxID=1079859 RepID=A0A1I5QH73_9BACT|nr:Crp/Fnr family transcriptional regulator [Pseudarcicella hirudinis]SFP45467.1 cAMP-binding domain of CRP or a regulatory subunit of cAMP-dependent protein kinases [Pseudarcicella hirudinis]
MNLISILNNIAPLSTEVQQEIIGLFKKECLPRHHLLHRNGDLCNKLYFVEKGLLRIFYYNDLGKDITYRFQEENQFHTVIDSYFQQKPSLYNVEALEDSILYSMPLSELDKLREKHLSLQKVYIFVLQHFLLENSERITALQFHSAQERYNTLMEKQPLIIQRAPLGHIASYLGITQETLSRIRSRIYS